MNRWILLAIVATVSSVVAGEAAERISVRSFGVEPDTRRNALPAVMKALDACRTKSDAVLVFPKGRYDFWPVLANNRDFYQSNTSHTGPMRCGILVEGMTNVVIDGQDSTFIYHDRISPFVVSGSARVTIQNVSIDWDIPLTAQAEVRAVNGRNVDLHIDPVGYPFEVKDNRIVFLGEGWTSAWWGTMEFDRKTRLIPPRSGDATLGGWGPQARIGKTAKDAVRLYDCGGCLPAVGNMLVLRHSERDHAGIFLRNSRDVACRNVNLYHSGGLGLLAQYCENVTLDHYNAVPNKARGRYLSGHDDGAQISNCGGLVSIENCEFEGLMDDPINIHGTCVKIIKRVAPDRLRARFMRDVLIRSNEFRYPCLSSLYQFCDGIISICPEIPRPDPARPFHRNIRIEHNSFDMFDRSLLYAFSVDGLSFVGNRVTRNSTVAPFHPRKDLLTFVACRNVAVKDNDIAGDVLSHSIRLEQMDKKEVEVDPGQRISAK